LLGDVIAGFTVGAVVIPQGMAYAKIALLSPEYGLYSSFVGVCIYLFFATSKDITIGPTGKKDNSIFAMALTRSPPPPLPILR